MTAFGQFRCLFRIAALRTTPEVFDTTPQKRLGLLVNATNRVFLRT